MFTIWLSCAFFQIAFWGLFARPFRRKPQSAMLGHEPLVSIVVCARNEAENLKKLLPVLLAQSYKNYEVIVVNDASQDDTDAILQSFVLQYPNFKIINIHKKEELGKKAALAQGIAAAAGEWILLTDADCQPVSVHWIDKMLEAATPQTEIVLGYSPYRPDDTWLNRWIRYETIYTAIQYLSAAQTGNAYMGVGRNLMYKKALYERLRGFAAHAHLPSGDDDLFVNRAATPTNTAVCLHPDAFVITEPKRSWAELLAQKRRHISVGGQYKWQHKYALAALALSQALFFLGIIVLPIFFVIDWFVMLFIIGLRQFIYLLAWAGWIKKLNEKKILLAVCFLDIFVPIYYLTIVFALRQPRLTRW